MSKNKVAILTHLAGWIAFFLMPFLLFNISHTNNRETFSNFYLRKSLGPESNLSFFLLKNLFLMVFFYINLYILLPKFYYFRKKTTYFLIVSVFMIVTVYLPGYVRNELMAGIPNLQNTSGAINGANMDRGFGFLHFLIIWFLSTIINLSNRYRLMEQTNKEMTVQKLNAELSYLKAQINPHFLFNTLNNIYALSICQNEQTPDAILKLSAIMRYVTQDADTETVPLEKELDYLENYIALQQLRSDDKLSVRFTVTGNAGNNVIAPLLLINFIENAFKYGVSNHVPCYVHISINIVANSLTLKVDNKVMTNTVVESTFTGTNNTLRRLQLQYANKHNLAIDERNELYKIILQLDLK